LKLKRLVISKKKFSPLKILTFLTDSKELTAIKWKKKKIQVKMKKNEEENSSENEEENEDENDESSENEDSGEEGEIEEKVF